MIIKNTTAAVLLVTILVGCNAKSSQDEQVNYQELAPLKIELVKEVTGGDSYLPGRLRDLLIIADSMVLVSDVGTNTIEQFTTDGQHAATIAKAGRGPGELSNLVKMYQGAGDTLFVRNRLKTERIDAFTRGRDGIYEYRQSWKPDKSHNRYVTILGARGRAKYYAKASIASRDFHKTATSQSEYTNTPVAIVNKNEKIIHDSLSILQTPNIVAEFGPRSMRIIGMSPYQPTDRFKVLGNGKYAIARADSAELQFYSANDELQHRLSLNIEERPVTGENVEFLLDKKNLEGDDRKKMEARIPETKPPFLNAWITKSHIWLHTDIGENGKEMVVLSKQGDPLGKFYLPFVDEIQEIKGNRVYVLHKNSETGHSIRIYEVAGLQ